MCWSLSQKIIQDGALSITGAGATLSVISAAALISDPDLFIDNWSTVGEISPAQSMTLTAATGVLIRVGGMEARNADGEAADLQLIREHAVAAAPQHQARADVAREGQHRHGEGAQRGELELQVQVVAVGVFEARDGGLLRHVGAHRGHAREALQDAVRERRELLEGRADLEIKALDHEAHVDPAERHRVRLGA